MCRLWWWVVNVKMIVMFEWDGDDWFLEIMWRWQDFGDKYGGCRMVVRGYGQRQCLSLVVQCDEIKAQDNFTLYSLSHEEPSTSSNDLDFNLEYGNILISAIWLFLLEVKWKCIERKCRNTRLRTGCGFWIGE